MTYETKKITLKNGTDALITQPDPDRAEEMLDFLRDISSETEFISRTADEVYETVEVERQKLEGMVAADNMIMLVCMVNDRIAGNCSLQFLKKIKMRHRAAVGIAIRQAYWNLGIGTALFEEMIRIAKEKGARQMELEMTDGNVRGLALYTKMGFAVTGRRPDAFLMSNGTYRDEILMTKML
ncbi:MAG: GNAT family N-acetyltransferase [Clostridia bacterium]|nr:GNAT family N-acetyltransferase [Clostridia bacterium]